MFPRRQNESDVPTKRQHNEDTARKKKIVPSTTDQIVKEANSVVHSSECCLAQFSLHIYSSLYNCPQVSKSGYSIFFNPGVP